MTCDVVVVGLGGMGSAALANVAMRGATALGIEQFERGHANGSSTGRSRLIRKAYFEHPNYVPLLLRAYDAWEKLERLCGARVLYKTSLLIAGHPQSSIVRGATRSAQAYDIPVEHLDARAIRTRFPAMRPLDDEIGLLEPDGGFVVPEAAVDGYLRVAQMHGAEARFETRVTSWSRNEAAAFEVRLADGTSVRGRRIVLCLGPWWRTFAQTPLPVRLQRNVQVWFRPDSDAFSIETFPAFVLDRAGLPEPMYGFPDYGFGVKAAFHGLGATIDAPDLLDRSVRPSDIEPLQDALSRWMPGSAAAFIDAKACLYSRTPDDNFVIGLQPDAPGVVVAGGFSGHGFKFASVVGEILADLALEGGTAYDLAFLAPRTA